MSRYDPDDPEQVAERQRTASLLRQQGEADLTFVLESPQGRRVLAWVIEQAGLLQPSHRPGNALSTAFAEGRRDIALLIYNATTNLRQGAFLTALMAEVMSSPHVGNRRPARPERDAAGE